MNNRREIQLVQAKPVMRLELNHPNCSPLERRIRRERVNPVKKVRERKLRG
jgi:hypothetical protein